MINDFGSEFINLLEYVGNLRHPIDTAGVRGGGGFNLSDYFDSHIRPHSSPSDGFIVYPAGPRPPPSGVRTIAQTTIIQRKDDTLRSPYCAR